RVERKAEHASRHNVNANVSESFPRRLRLTRAIEFQQVFKNNIRRSDACITILVGKNKGTNPRLGFAIARKQVPTAVKRNALKRLFRESFRKSQHRLPTRDIVIMVRREILLTRPAKLRASLDQHWNSIIKQCASP
ncbi:MAG: ribonuclease P protein component, partial [Aestuariibacter sp.]|nr:ribonuclease P protein component [Aestuariibacter sp.]